MSLFFILAAVLVVATLALLLPVLMRPDTSVGPDRTRVNVAIAKTQMAELKQRHETGDISDDQLKEETERLEAGLARDIDAAENTAANNRGQWLMWPLLAALPVAAGAIYLTLGTPQAINPENRMAAAANPQSTQASAQAATQQTAPPNMREIVARIKQQLAEQPEDAQGWFMLGRAHLTLGEYQEAVDALREAYTLDTGNVDVTIRLADAIALNQQGSLAGEPAQLLKTALESRPDHPQGLWLYGMALNQSGEWQNAIDVWNSLLPQLGEDPASAREVQQLIANATQQLEEGGSAPQQAVVPANQAAQPLAEATGGVVLQVNVAPGLVTDLPADTAVFVYAKATSGPPMPLAVVQRTLGELPFEITLTDDQAMIEGMNISAFSSVSVGARIARTGNPIAQPGDYFIELENIDTGSAGTPLELTISETVQ